MDLVSDRRSLAAAVAMVVLASVAGGAAAAGSTEVRLSPSSESLTAGDTTRFWVNADPTSGGVGSYNFTVTVDEPSVAGITAINLQVGDPATRSARFGDDNSSVTASAEGGDTTNRGEVTLAKVEVTGRSQGSAALEVTVRVLTDEEGESYFLMGTEGATLQVREGPGRAAETTPTPTPTPTPGTNVTATGTPAGGDDGPTSNGLQTPARAAGPFSGEIAQFGIVAAVIVGLLAASVAARRRA